LRRYNQWLRFEFATVEDARALDVAIVGFAVGVVAFYEK
jgi:hypothetical protein